MADKSQIEWTDATWNPIVGCSILSPGCTHCYAMRMASRIEAMGGAKHYAGTTKKVNGNAVWTGKLAMAPVRILTEPLRWQRPRRIFVNSMGDLFHEDVPDEWIDRVFAVMALAPQHTFQVLTKRAKRMREYMNERWQPAPAHRLAWPGGDAIDIPAETKGEDREDHVRSACEPFLEMLGLVDTDNDDLWTEDGNAKAMTWAWPLANVWLGVSTERQQEADERIPELLATPAAVRFVSAEPLLGPIDFTAICYQDEDAEIRVNALTAEAWVENSLSASAYSNESDGVTGLDWIIVGGESGPGARPMHPGWARSIRDQCAAAGVPFFFKQWGAWADSTDADDYIAGSEDFIFAADGTVLGAGGRVGRKLNGMVDPDWRQKGGAWMTRTNKKTAGRLLDGIEHSGMPEAREVPAL